MAMVTRWRMPPDSWWGYSPRRCTGAGMPTWVRRSIAAPLASDLLMPRWKRIDSVSAAPIFLTGFSDVIGSWNTIAISRPQKCFDCCLFIVVVSTPLNRTVPVTVAVDGSRPMIERTSTDFPEPDSPTMPIVSPRPSENDTPSTARSGPRPVLKVVRRFSTSTSGTPVGASSVLDVSTSVIDRIPPPRWSRRLNGR